MSPAAAVIEKLVRAIPVEDDAALVAQSGERARITSRAGSRDVGSAALTMQAIDSLNAALLPAEQLQTLEQTGVAQFDLELSSVNGRFTVVAASTQGERWLEIRRQRASEGGHPASTLPPQTRPAPARASQPEPELIAQSAAALRPMSAHDDSIGLASLEFPRTAVAADADELTIPDDVLERPAVGPDAADAIGTDLISPASAVTSAATQPVFSLRAFARWSSRARIAAALCLTPVLVVAGIFSIGRSSVRRNAPAAGLIATRQPAAPPDAIVAMPAPAAPQAKPDSHTRDAIARPQPAPSPAAQAADSEQPLRSGFSIQVAAVRTRDEADRVATQLVTGGYPAYVVRGDGAAAAFYRVRVGPYPDRGAAQEVARQIEHADGLKGWIAVEDSLDPHRPK